MTTRCPVCGRPVPSFFDHVDVECEEWPSDWSFDDLKIPAEFKASHDADRAPVANIGTREP